MLTFDSMPQVRVVRERGRQVTPPRRPATRARSELRVVVRDTLGTVFGMWPLTGPLLFAVAMMWITGYVGAGAGP